VAQSVSVEVCASGAVGAARDHYQVRSKCATIAGALAISWWIITADRAARNDKDWAIACQARTARRLEQSRRRKSKSARITHRMDEAKRLRPLPLVSGGG